MKEGDIPETFTEENEVKCDDLNIIADFLAAKKLPDMQEAEEELEKRFINAAAELLDILNAQNGLKAKISEYYLGYKGLINIQVDKAHLMLDVTYEPENIRIKPRVNQFGTTLPGIRVFIAEDKGRIFATFARRVEGVNKEENKEKRLYFDDKSTHTAFLKAIARSLYRHKEAEYYTSAKLKAIYDQTAPQTKTRIFAIPEPKKPHPSKGKPRLK